MPETPTDVGSRQPTTLPHLDLVRAVAVAANTAWASTTAFDVAVEVVAEYAGWPFGIAWAVEHRHDGGWLVPSAVHVATGADEPMMRGLIEPMALTDAGVLGALVSVGSPGSLWRLDTDTSAVSRGAAAGGLTHAAAFSVVVGDAAAAVLQFLLPADLDVDRRMVAAMETVCLQLSRVLEREATERNLAERERQLRHLLAATGGALLSIDATGRIVQGVGRALGLTETGPEQLVGERLGRVLRDAGDRLERLQQAGPAMEPFDGRLRTPDDRLVAVEVRAWPAAEGGPAHVLVRPRYDDALDPGDPWTGVVGAADRGEIEVHYQPVIDLATGRLASLEGLARWRHPDRGLVAPGLFIPEAETTGEIHAIGRTVLTAACASAVRWRAEAVGDLRVAVNLSPKELDDPTLVETVDATLRASGLPPSALTLEITESALGAETPAALRQLWQLRELGISLAIDDFGTGYSSLSRLRAFPFDTLKIDRTFIKHVVGASDDVRLLRATVELAHAFDMRVVAEGVENPAQLAVALDHGCTEAQGYLFSRPLPVDAIDRLLHDPWWDTDSDAGT